MMNGETNGSFYQKSYKSLQIEEIKNVDSDRIKIVKQSKVDFNEIETKLPDTTGCSLVETQDIELKIEQQILTEEVKSEDNSDKSSTLMQQEENLVKPENESKDETEVNDDKEVFESEKITCSSETNNEKTNIEINDEKDKISNENSDEAMDN
jgi:hypothetical protein